MCLCDERHYWSLGENRWECDKCGRLYYKGDGLAFTDDYTRYRLEHDHLTIVVEDSEI